MLAGLWWPAVTRARSTAAVPNRPISRSVAMLSLAEIICWAALRTVIWAPGGSLSRPAEPSFLPSLVMVR